MRELSVRLRFTTPCLGKEKVYYRDPVTKKTRYKFVFSRSPSGRVVFLPTWWRSIVARAAELLCWQQDATKNIRFGCEIDGQPRKQLYARYYEDDKFAMHEIFGSGDVIGVTCIVPNNITDDQLVRLLSYAGRYFGISPARPNEFGFFDVLSVQRSGVSPRQKGTDEVTGAENRDNPETDKRCSES